MRRLTSFPVVLMFSAIVAALLANSTSAEANCQAKLAGNSFDCTFKFSDGPPATVCVSFLTGGSSSNFDLLIPPSGDYGCSCETKGSFSSPSFDASGTGFECVAGFGFAFTGKVEPNNKLAGQGVGLDGEGIAFSCKKVAACL